VTAAEFQRSDGTPSARFDSLDAPLSEFVESVVVGQSANPPRTFYAPHYLNPVARLLSGDDTVSGSDGTNILEGYGGADDLHGGGGNDISAFAPGYGADRILDFVAASGHGDRLDFSGFPNLKSVVQVLAQAWQEGLDTCSVSAVATASPSSTCAKST
jgi:hypothetical protein